jgi:hypothetical protein
MDTKGCADGYADKSLEIIKGNKLLAGDEFDSLNKIKESLNHNFWCGQLFRSKVEMEVSVLNDLKHPTNDSKYWQAIREQNVHFSELVSLSYEYKKRVQEISIKKADEGILSEEINKTCWSGDAGHNKFHLAKKVAEREIIKIDIDKMNWGLIQMTKTTINRVREIMCWQDILDKLKPVLRWSADTYEEHQWASYKIRFGNQLENAVKSGASASSSEMNNLIGLFTTIERVTSGVGIQLNDDRSKVELPSEKKIIT